MTTVARHQATERQSRPASRTIGALWQKALTEQRSDPAYLVEGARGWTEVTWHEAGQRVEEIAFGLLALGVRKGDSFGIVGPTELEWALADFALARIGAVSAPVYPTSSAADCAYMLQLVGAVGSFVDETTAELVPALPHVIPFSALGELEERGRAYRAEKPEALAQAEAAVTEDDLFTFIFTSGTSGPPKACMIRHRNYYAMAATIDAVPELAMRGDLLLLYLPLAHNFGRLLSLLGAYEGYTIAFLPDPLRTADAVRQVQPTILPSVPRLYEKVYARIRRQFDAATGLRRKLVEWALSTGREASRYRRRGEQLPLGLLLRHRIADRLVYRKVKERLGGRLRFAFSGGAPLASEIAEFFHALDILVLEGYGLSECTTACAVNRPGRVEFGTVGPALPGFEIVIAPDGEVLIRSETVFAGYYRDEQATREVLEADGWLHSGDLGELDEDGFLRITGRKKDIIVTSSGKNIAPQNLENALRAADLVSEALVLGDRRPHLVALVALDEDAAAGRSAVELERAVQEIVDEVNRGRSRFEQIRRFAILSRDFSAERGEVTPTLKLRRRVAAANFADVVERLYAG